MRLFQHPTYLLWAFILLAGCASGGQHTARDSSQPMAATAHTMPSESFRIAEDRSFQQETTRKVLFSAFLTLSVFEPDTVNASIQDIAAKYDGYINRIGTRHTVIRVKSEYLEFAIDEISRLGKLQDKNITGQDVTDEYTDYQIRLDNAHKARDRYLQLLSQAENVETTLMVERELERLNGTIDLLKGWMNRIDHLSEYSTISINFTQQKKPGILGYIGLGIYHSVKWLFVRN